MNKKKSRKGKNKQSKDYTPKDFKKVIALLKKSTKDNEEAMSEVIAQEFDPFAVLVSCIMSLRTKDTTTLPLARDLFKKYPDAKSIAKLPVLTIEKLIYPVSFYKNKAKFIKETCKILIEKHNGCVPDTQEELLELPGIGRKCMGITLTTGYGKNESIAVDTHVHRISNILGWVRTKMPDDTEQVLMKKIPKPYWKEMNNLLVLHGQNQCLPVSPFCSTCAIRSYCPRIGVKKSR